MIIFFLKNLLFEMYLKFVYFLFLKFDKIVNKVYIYVKRDIFFKYIKLLCKLRYN